MKNTKAFSDKLGIVHPIIQAPMAGGATTPELVAAVSNAGGLGSLGAGYMAPNDVRKAIQKIRSLTEKPFATNLFIPTNYEVTPQQIQKSCEDIEQCCVELDHRVEPVAAPYAPCFEEQIEVLLQEKVPVFSFTFGLLDEVWIKQFQSIGTLLIGTATTLLEACALEKSGVDMIVLQGSEAGGHRGTFLEEPEDSLSGLKNLISQCFNRLKIPFIAAGGVMNGKEIYESILLGAAGVQMGTAFLSSHESGISDSYKKILLSQEKDHTVLTRVFSGKFARGIRNQFIACMQTKSKNILDYPVQNALTKSMRKKAKENDLVEYMSLWAGQGSPFCRDIGAAELMHQLVLELNEAQSVR